MGTNVCIFLFQLHSLGMVDCILETDVFFAIVIVSDFKVYFCALGILITLSPLLHSFRLSTLLFKSVVFSPVIVASTFLLTIALLVLYSCGIRMLKPWLYNLTVIFNDIH